MHEALKFFQFLLATAGAASLAVVFANDFVITVRYKGVIRPLNRKPFICALCMGFYLSPLVYWLVYNSISWRDHTIAMFAGSAFAWLFHRIVTGDS